MFLEKLLKINFFLLILSILTSLSKGDSCEFLLDSKPLGMVSSVDPPFFECLKEWKKGDSLTSLKEKYEIFKEEKGDVNKKDKKGKTLLFYASALGNPFIVNLLLRDGSFVNSLNGLCEKTPLMKAVSKGRNSQVIRDLLKYGAQRDIMDKKGFLPFFYALKKKNFYFASLVCPLSEEIFLERVDLTDKIFLRDRYVKTYLWSQSLREDPSFLSLNYLLWNFLKDTKEIDQDPFLSLIQKLIEEKKEGSPYPTEVKELFRRPDLSSFFLKKIQNSENFIISEASMEKIRPYYYGRKKFSALEAQVLLAKGSVRKIRTYRDKLSFIENVIFFLALAQISG